MLRVVFRKRATNYRALLRKMTCKDQASYDSTLPASYFAAGYKHFDTDKLSNRAMTPAYVCHDAFIRVP